MLAGMATLGSIITWNPTLGAALTPQALDVGSLVASLVATQSVGLTLGTSLSGLTASIQAWTDQDDDAHEPCSLTACRTPLHPGPCKGWKHTLHSVSPGTYHQVEAERVRKANIRRTNRIATLKSQNKPIPRRLLTEIKAKPAPAHAMTAVPHAQVNQKADLAGGQAHHAGAAINKAAGITPNTAPLPLGPKAKKPTIAGRGPAFVITQPKVTDTYKLDKAEKITPAEWSALSPGDKKAIRDELAAIKVRGFGPQQTKADALLAKLPAATTLGQTAGHVTAPSAAKVQILHPVAPQHPGKVTLGQALKSTPKVPGQSHSQRVADVKRTMATPQLPAPSAPAAAPSAPQPSSATHVVSPLGAEALIKQHGSADITYAKGTAYEKTFADVGLQGRGDHQHYLVNKGAGDRFIVDKNGKELQHLPKQGGITVKTTNAPAPAKAAPPAAFPAHVQAARAVAGRAVPKASTSKAQVDTYGKLTKADFDQLDSATQRTIRDDLANAKAKFLDPKKQQTAADLLNRFGSRTPPPASAPAAPGAKGYSDPMNQAIKAAQGADVDEMLKRVGQLSHASIANLTDADRKQILAHLDYVATRHATQAPKTADKAAALKRIIEAGKPTGGPPRDHEPSINELHADENTPAAVAARAVAAALKAADAKGGTPLDRADRLRDLGALSKPQFDALPQDDKDKITAALHELHPVRSGQLGTVTTLDPDAEKALITYTGVHPGVHRLQQAEAAYRKGTIDADRLHRELLTARVVAPTKTGDPTSPHALLAKEEERVAVDNPSLPHWLRAEMVGNSYSARGGQYHSIAAAKNKYNFGDAPRLSSSDISDIFRATQEDMAGAHPIHQEAVKALRENVLQGLAAGSPWSAATKSHVVDNLLHINGGTGNDEIPAERLKEFKALPVPLQVTVERVLRDRITAQTDDHAKTATWLQANQLGGRESVDLTPTQLAAVRQAADRFTRADPDVYRRMDPTTDYDPLPNFVRDAIQADLDRAQTRAERNGPTETWTVTDNPLKVMPAALADHLNGTRAVSADRNARAAADIANYGTKIYTPASRAGVYGDVSLGRFKALPPSDQRTIHTDLEKIAADTGNTLAVRYKARVARDIYLDDNPSFNLDQSSAIGMSNPAFPPQDSSVKLALTGLSKADFDSLNGVYREAIDERIKTMSGSDQQLFTAKFHPSTAAAQAASSPAGVTPTTAQAGVPPHVQAALDTIYGVHSSGKSHTMAHQLSTYGQLRGHDFAQLNGQEQGHLLGDLSFIATTAKGPSADKAKKLIDRFTPAGTPSGNIPTGAVIPPANSLPGQVRYATPLKGLEMAKDSGKSGDKWISLPGGGRVWGEHGAAGLMLQHVDPQTGEKRYLMVQRGPAISDPGKWTFPGGASDSKETPHQGAARETIEELGLKADALKDALVHGDHTFSVPNHTWKYTTVAAQVPTMIKPNLTTAHARAETSDAKWMTIEEIRDLDKSGKLHHPIAGGKLEQNVISLYPQGSGRTLGQVVRPGPITKRPNRLHLPSGGRQAPASFNAWPHPHKQSTGKNLVGDKTSIDALRQQIKTDRALYDGKTADGRLAAIGAKQGFDDTPTVMSKKEVDRLLATGDYIEAWRGVKGSSRWSGSGKTAAQINEEMRSGPAYYGKGIFGNGYYLATQKSVAQQYADNTKNSIARILIPKSALTEHYNIVEREAHAAGSKISKAKGSSRYEEGTLYDPGRYAAAKGLDGIEIQHHHTSGGGWAKHIAKSGQPAFNWLNRSVLIIQEAQ